MKGTDLGSVKMRLAIIAAGFLSMVWGFQALIFNHAPGVFNAKEEDMSFGWYVPLFSLYVVWVERKKILKAFGSSSLAGAVAMLPFLALGFLGARGLQVRFEIVAFAGLIVSFVWAVAGWKAAKSIMFPALFLLFCVPLATFLDVVTVHLRLLASGTAYGILHGLGADVVRQGTMIAAADGSFSIDVAEPCSGLRSIFALMALTAAYSYLTQPTWLKKAVLFALSVPIAVLGNVARILTICMVGTWASSGFATGFYHDYSGYVVFIVAIALMVAAGEGLKKLGKREKGDGEEKTEDMEQGAGKTGAAFFALAVLAAAMAWQAMTPECVVTEAPEICWPGMEGFAIEELPASEAELTVLPADTKIEKRKYTDADGEWFLVTAVVGGTSKSSIHRPELCLPAQGYAMVSPRNAKVGGTDWHLITLAFKEYRPQMLAYTFANQDGFRTASHTKRIFRDIIDRSLFNRIDRWVMVTVNASTADDSRAKTFLGRLEGMVK